MSKQFLKLLSVLLFSVASFAIANEKEIMSLDEANTIGEISTFANNFYQVRFQKELQNSENGWQNVVKNPIFFREIGKMWVASGEKIYSLTHDKTQLTKGIQLKVDGLKWLIIADKIEMQKQEQSTPSKYQIILDQLIDEFEKKGQYPAIVNTEHFSKFSQKDAYELIKNFSLEKFDEFVKYAKKLCVVKPANFRPVAPFFSVLDVVSSAEVAQSNPQLVDKTTKDLIAFVNSEKCNLSKKEKKQIIDQLEGYILRIVGANPEIYGKTVDDNDFDWAALRGKYVLVMFTASRCAPCKGEIPGMLSAYEKYHDRGLEIVSIYIWDRLEVTKKIIEDEKIPWICISEELTKKAGLPSQEKKYMITGIPIMFLADKDGKILTKARGETLQKKLAELFPDEK
jgi:glutathione peroxidase-family protein